VPHPGLHQRNFVLLPLYDIAPGLVLPDGRKLSEMVAACSREGIVAVDEG
jgi:2-amino-4-hydroxy-6-hydroxymethyldihydropteridine diphosphokinase